MGRNVTMWPLCYEVLQFTKQHQWILLAIQL